jgi:nucleoside diphosphate kinase
MTLAILKPDTVADGNAGKVLAHLESKGFTIAACASCTSRRSRRRPSTPSTAPARSSRAW